MTVSFRLRQFTYAALALATVLAIVVFTGWRTLLAVEREHLDTRLCQEVRRLLGPLPPGEDLTRLRADVALKLRLDQPGRVLLESRHADGALRWQSARWPDGLDRPDLEGRAAPGPSRADRRASDDLRDDRRGSCRVATAWHDGAEWRVARADDAHGAGLVAADLRGVGSELTDALARVLGLVVPLSLAVSALGAWLLATLAMRPVIRLREAMRALTPQRLDRRLSSDGEDREFADLIAAYNLMLERLEASFQQAARFSSDAAHELQTPLTILRGRLEQAARQAASEAQQAELLVMLDEVGRLADIVRKLLLLSRADAGRLEVRRATVDFSAMLAELVADAPLLLQRQRFESRIEPGLTVQGDAVLLQQLLNNLLSNAVRHGRPDGRIEVQARSRGDRIELRMTNDCAPLDAEARARFFERFYRADAARSRHAGGSGLGLGLAREIARAHGGDLVLEPTPHDVVSLCATLPRG